MPDSIVRHDRKGRVVKTGGTKSDIELTEKIAGIFNKKIVWATIGDTLKINGTLVVVEIVPSKGGTMQYKTAWKRPSEKIDAVPLNHTPEAVLSPPHSYNERV